MVCESCNIQIHDMCVYICQKLYVYNVLKLYLANILRFVVLGTYSFQRFAIRDVFSVSCNLIKSFRNRSSRTSGSHENPAETTKKMAEKVLRVNRLFSNDFTI